MKKITLLLIIFMGFLTMNAQSSLPQGSVTAQSKKPNPESEINGFAHFYNASTNTLTLSADEVISSITLYNILGQQVISKKLFATKETINLEALKTGIYLANVEAKTSITTFKIVKR